MAVLSNNHQKIDMDLIVQVPGVPGDLVMHFCSIIVLSILLGSREMITVVGRGFLSSQETLKGSGRRSHPHHNICVRAPLHNGIVFGTTARDS
ncbi:hypothetical protein EI94DRAFT_1721020 [Lactarius quietus]|nr:hypothetical protein EI94DRAFT_1721020 [Lactarius quietus]